jgi:hypothetical protein
MSDINFENLFSDEDFEVDERLPTALAEYLKPETAIQAIEYWRDRKVSFIDAVADDLKYKIAAKVANADANADS